MATWRGRISRFLDEQRRAWRAANAYHRGRTLYDAKRYTEAIPLFEEAMGLIDLPVPDENGPIEDAALFGVKWEAGAGAMTLLAMACSEVGDHVRAEATVRWGLPRLEKLRAKAPSLFVRGTFNADWMSWAQSYLEHRRNKAIMGRHVAPGTVLDERDREHLAPIAEALTARVGAFTLAATRDTFAVCEKGHCGVLVKIAGDDANDADAVEAFACLFGAARAREPDLPARAAAELRAHLARVAETGEWGALSASEIAARLRGGYFVRTLEG